QYLATYATLSGTSMATPYVTGAAALIKSGWKNLTAQQVASILFASATDLGAPGIDPVYGRGMLNVDAALKPIGDLGAPTSTSSLSLGGTSVTTSGVTTTALQSAARNGALQIAAFD